MTRSPPVIDPTLDQPILERDAEVAAIDQAIERALLGTGTAIVVAGQHGIGTSTLLRRAAGAAAGNGFRVLRARGRELERSLPYGVAIELFGGLIRKDSEAFSGPAAIVRWLFVEPDEVPEPPEPRQSPDPIALQHGLFWLMLNLAEEGPVAIVVDDAQWSDRPTLRFLDRLIDRVDELPVLVVLGIGPDGEGGPADEIERLRTHRAATHLKPAALSEHGVGVVLAALNDLELRGALTHLVTTTTGGNPFFVTELASELARVDPDALDPDTVAAYLPERVGRYVEARLLGVSAAARALADALAILGDRATLHRAGRLSGLHPGALDLAIRQLTEAGFLADDPTPAFRQPMVRRAVETLLPAPSRAELQRRAGLILADDGAEPGVVGALLREAAPAGDPRVVDLLMAAADDALRRGEPRVAVDLLRRAFAEPPRPARRPELLRRVARAEAAAGLPTAPASYHAAIEAVDDQRERAELRLELGHTVIAGGQWAEGAAAFREGLAGDAGIDAVLRGRLEAAYLAAAWVSLAGDRTEIGERVRTLLAADRLGPAKRELAVWIGFQQGATVESTAAEMGGLVRRVFEEAPIEDLVKEGQVVELGAGVLLETDDLEFEMEMLTAAIDAARRTGPIGKVGLYSYCRSWPSYYTGRLADAIADVDEALRAAELGWEAFVPAAVTVAALAHVERDDLASARRITELEPDRWAGRVDTAMLLPVVRGRVALASGDVQEALAQLAQARQAAEASAMRNTVPVEWRTWTAMALLQDGRRSEARDVADEGVEIARAWGAEWPLGAALRIAGRVSGGTAGLEQLHESEELLRNSPARLEYVRLLMTLGVTLRRHGTLTDARDVLSRAADLAYRIGARAILSRATSELRAAGARPRRIALTGVASLTPAELRVANEALAGRTNREIAQALFVTPKAVEFHLANTYRKLGIEGRGGLAEAMGSPSGEPAEAIP